MPELLEISGLDDMGQEVKNTPSWSPVLWTVGALAAMYALGAVLSMKKTQGVLEGLGIIKPCRKQDLTSKKPKSKQKWCLWTKSESRIIGRHPSKSRAVKQERLIEMKKHGIPTRR